VREHLEPAGLVGRFGATDDLQQSGPSEESQGDPSPGLERTPVADADALVAGLFCGPSAVLRAGT